LKRGKRKENKRCGGDWRISKEERNREKEKWEVKKSLKRL
jgi:hypothetical protein